MQNNENGSVTALSASACPLCGGEVPEIDRLKTELASYQSAFRRINRLLSPETNQNIITGSREYLLTANSIREALLIESELFPEGYKDVSALEARLKEWEAFRDDFQSIEYHSQGMGCGIEDRGITDRYEACAHGWERAMDRVVEIMPEEQS